MVDKHKIMENESITKLLVHFSFPAIIGMLVNALYNIVDRIYIGNIKEVGYLAIAGVGIVFPVVVFVFGFAIMIGLGNATNMSLCLGRKEKDEADRYLGAAFAYGTLVSIILMLIIIFFINDIIKFLGGSNNTSSYAIIYLKIIACGFPASILGYVANAGIRSDGTPKMAMITLLIGAITNIVLDPIFIFLMNMGIKGAAIATIISQYISGIWAVYYFFSKHSVIKFHLKYFRLHWKKIKEITEFGSAPFAIQMGGSVVNYTYNNTIKIYGGDTGIGAMTIVQGIILFVLMPIFGINQGLQPILGYNYGAKLYNRVKEALFKAILGATGICVFYFFIIQFLSKYFINIFTHQQLLINIASKGLKIQTLMFPIVGFQIICSVYFQAIGKPKISLFMSLSRQIILLIPCILIMARLWGDIGVWYAGPTSDFLSTLLTFFLIKRELKELDYMQEEQEE